VSGLVLVVSYPKSGNTWIRALLTAFWDGPAALNINRLRIPNSANLDLLARVLGISISDLTSSELAKLRPNAIAQAVAGSKKDWFLKVHDAWLPSPDGEGYPLSPSSIDKIVYVVRDPRDVAVSLCSHLGMSTDEVISLMANPIYRIGLQLYGRRPYLPQLLSTWSAHVTSWIDHWQGRLLLVRYEDVLADPAGQLSRILKFVGTAHTVQQVEGAAEATKFETLQQLERLYGFIERPHSSTGFFRMGHAGNWRTILSAIQARRIEAAHAEVMHLLNYRTP
jgi:aryl sulfotransferase